VSLADAVGLGAEGGEELGGWQGIDGVLFFSSHPRRARVTP